MNYLQWNEKLLNNFFFTDKESQEIPYFYIDEGLLNDLAAKPTGLNDFIEAINNQERIFQSDLELYEMFIKYFSFPND